MPFFMPYGSFASSDMKNCPTLEPLELEETPSCICVSNHHTPHKRPFTKDSTRWSGTTCGTECRGLSLT